MNYRPLQLGLGLVVSLHAFDELVLTIALPTITADLGGGDWYGVCLASYILLALVGTVWAGDSIDQRGPLWIFLVGYGLFALGLIAAMLASSIDTFIFARALQGLGGGISWTVAYAVTNRVFSSSERPRMIAWLDSAWLVPSLLAPTIGGYIIDFLDWHWIFLGQLPFLLVAVCLVYPHLKPLNQRRDNSEGVSASSNRAIWRALRIATGSGLLVTVLAAPVTWQWLVAIPLSMLIIWRPLIKIMPAGFFRAKNGLAAAVMMHFLIFFAFYGPDMFLPLLLIEVRQMSSSIAGLAFTACAISWVSASFLQAWLSTRLLLQQSLSIGMLLVVLGLALVACLLIPDSPFWLVYVGWSITGFGMGLAYNSVVSATMDFTKPGEEGATSTANGIASSLAIGLAAGIGGAITNQAQFAGAGLSAGLAIIWLVAAVAALWCLIVIRRGFVVAISSTD